MDAGKCLLSRRIGASRYNVSSIFFPVSLKLTPAQFQEASALLVEVLQFAAPADALLSAHFRRNPKLGSQDRALIADCVYGVLRKFLALRWLMPEGTPRLWLLVWLARF